MPTSNGRVRHTHCRSPYSQRRPALASHVLGRRPGCQKKQVRTDQRPFHACLHKHHTEINNGTQAAHRPAPSLAGCHPPSVLDRQATRIGSHQGPKSAKTNAPRRPPMACSLPTPRTDRRLPQPDTGAPTYHVASQPEGSSQRRSAKRHQNTTPPTCRWDPPRPGQQRSGTATCGHTPTTSTPGTARGATGRDGTGRDGAVRGGGAGTGEGRGGTHDDGGGPPLPPNGRAHTRRPNSRRAAAPVGAPTGSQGQVGGGRAAIGWWLLPPVRRRWGGGGGVRLACRPDRPTTRPDAPAAAAPPSATNRSERRRRRGEARPYWAAGLTAHVVRVLRKRLGQV